MIRQSIQLNTHKYILDLYKNGIDTHEHFVSKKFCMLRSYKVEDLMFYDKEIYIIDYDLLISYFNKEKKIIFPDGVNNDITKESLNIYSYDYNKYNQNFFNFKSINAPDITKLGILEEKGDILTFNPDYNIKCDILRIYKPITTKGFNGIIHIENYINNIHVHWLIKDYTDYDYKGAVKPFKVDNFEYSEYIEFNIPSPENIINKDVYFYDILNSTKTETSGNYNFDFLFKEVKESETNKKVYTSTFALSLPYTISEKNINENCVQLYRTYYPTLQYTVKNAIITHPLIVKCVPVSSYDYNDGVFIIDENINLNSDIFNFDTKITLSSKFSFVEGNPCIVNEFNFPFKETFKSVAAAYEYMYGIDLTEYSGLIEVPEEYDPTDEEYILGTDEFKEQKQCGFLVRIYNNYNKTSVIYQQLIDIENPKTDLDDFCFNLSGIFNSWDDFFGTLCVTVTFVDRYLGKIYEGNDVILNEDIFKYLLNKKENSINKTNKQNEINTINEMDLSKINFIDKINCVIKTDSQKESAVIKQNNSPRIIYKPVFYKVAESQKIELKNKFVQNIGINLSEYLTKVEIFKLAIGDNEFIEAGRNDVFVIFNIDSKILDRINGEYHILNQDDEYITSGKYMIV